MTLITKAKKSAVAYKKPPISTEKRGRPKCKGVKIKLTTLFKTHKEVFSEMLATIYGKEQSVSYYTLTALWGQGLYHELRFMLIIHNGSESILVSRDTSLSAEKIITLYSYRFKIERTFRAFNQTFAGFSYHFCTKFLKELNCYSRKIDRPPLESLTSEAEQQAVVQTFDAIEGFVQFVFIAHGLVQLLALKFSKECEGVLWLRTLRETRETIPSEATAMHYLRQSVLWQSQKKQQSTYCI
ncbi:transposase [Carnobacterium mobile]|uniref:transposase n=1 Tax=Carnobacterium mobile TaxID=2750 RepID=UPI00068A6DD8|nr:transposase [Carnobacterium mobile]